MLWMLAAMTCILGIIGLLMRVWRHSPGDGGYDLGSVSRDSGAPASNGFAMR
jgi:hypothetical protein